MNKNIDDDLICQLCGYNYILLTNENKCLDLSKYEGIDNYTKFSSCEKLTYDDNKELYCSRCQSQYFLLKENDNDKGQCMDISLMYSNNTDYYYFYPNFPCQEGINIGDATNPKYSCTKCYQIFEFKNAYKDLNTFIKVINNNEQEFCSYQSWIKLENCTEAINKTNDFIQKYDCQKCLEDNKLAYDSKKEINYCEYEYVYNPKKCLVTDCKTCKTGNNYFCSECESTKFEVNTATGQCVKKTEVVAAVTWKDIFRLEMNGQHERNGQTFNGPSLILRGITSSQINTRHGFLIYLTFKVKVKTSKLRNIDEEEIKIPAICEALNSVEETSDDVNMIDYECLANNTNNEDLTDYNLGGIEEEENNGLLKKSNLNSLTEGKTMEDFIKTESIFTDEDLMKYITFKMNEVKNQTAINNIFDFEIYGLLNKQIDSLKKSVELDLNEIEDKIKCNFTVEINFNAKLNCLLDINKYNNLNLFSFKTSEIKVDANEIYIPKLDEILLLNEIKEKETSKEKHDDNDDKKNYTGIIIGCVIGGVILIGAGIAILIYFIKKSKKTDSIPIDSNIKLKKGKPGEIKVSPFETGHPKTNDRISLN